MHVWGEGGSPPRAADPDSHLSDTRDSEVMKATLRRATSTLSQKQFGKYFSAEIFPVSMGIVPVLFKKISIQQHPRKKYL
jgi:hypothetical protein